MYERHGSAAGEFHFVSGGEGEYKLCFTAKGVRSGGTGGGSRGGPLPLHRMKAELGQNSGIGCGAGLRAVLAARRPHGKAPKAEASFGHLITVPLPPLQTTTRRRAPASR